MAVAMSGGLADCDEIIAKRVQEVAGKRGWTMTQVALAWIKGRGCNPIVGLNSTSIQRLDEACALRDVKLTEDEMKYLEEPYKAKAVVGHF